MKVFAAILITAFILRRSYALECYQCMYNTEIPSAPWSNDASCAEDGEKISAELIYPCPTRNTVTGYNYDVCYFSHEVYPDGEEFYRRSCGVSSTHYDGETDKCESYTVWGVEHKECVCDSDNCNPGHSAKASLILVLTVFSKQMLNLIS